MPFQRSNSAASMQILSLPTNELGASSFSSLPPVIATKSALAESSSKSRHNQQQIGTSASARKQHHVSFKEDPEPEPAATPSIKQRGRNQRAPNSSSRSDASDVKDRASEHGSSRHSASRASSRQSRRNASEPESSSKCVAGDTAPSSASSRHRRSRHRSDKRSERSHQSEHAAAKPNTQDSAAGPTASRGAPSFRSEASTSPSKRESKSKDGASSSGKRSRQPSAQGILPDLRNHEASRSEAGTRSHYSTASRRDRFAPSQDARSIHAESSVSRSGRQLFDPRRDDPVKFASQQRSQAGDARDARSTAGGPSPRIPSMPSSQSQILMRRDPSNTSSGSHLGRSPIMKPSVSDIPFTPAIDPSDPRALQAHAVEVKQVYRSLSSMEASLQEAHQAEVEKARHDMADYTPPDLRDRSYFISLIGKHRQLAELHSSFLEMTCRPEFPRELQELAEVRNIPSRLWQTAFHLMLESLRTSISSTHPLQTNQRRSELLDHLTEFIYYAYSFYSALQESEHYKNLRRAWIESLGDLSRYRMAVAGLASSIDEGGDEIRNKQPDNRDKQDHDRDRQIYERNKRLDDRNKKWDDHNKHLDSRNRQSEALNRQSEAVNRQFDALNRQFQALDRQYDDRNRKSDDRDRQWNALNRQSDALSRQADALSKQLDNVHTRFDDHNSGSLIHARIDDDDNDAEDDDEDDGSLKGSSADDHDDDGRENARRSSPHKGEANAQSGNPSNRDPGKEEAPANEVDKASIGTAALGDWEWTEKETWRQTAKGWYAMGITETPNIGRLHHHLGVLSRGEHDLRALYHLAKSLIAAKPFASARDSILTLFDQERQARRVRRDSSIEELFLYLHGVLITRVQLDDFEPVFDRLMAKLTRLVEQQGPAGLSQSVWTMMAVVNIAGLFQYGAEDSVLADLLLQQAGKSGGRSNRTGKSKSNTPTALLVSSNAAKTDDNLLSELPRDVEWDDPSDDESEAGDDVQVISLEAKGGNEEQEAADELPLLLEHAATLCFSMQSLTFDLSSEDAAFRSNPYNTTLSTFLVSLCQSKKAFRMLEHFIPWDPWLRSIEQSVSLTERSWPKCLSSSYITAQLLLPEDFCLRGILGLSRHLYDRNLWRNAANDGAIAAPQGFDNEVEVLDADDAELYTRTESAWRIAASRRKDGGGESLSTLDAIRGYRLAFVARKLAKAARGFDFDTKTSTVSLSKMLIARLVRRRMEEEQRQLELRIQELSLQGPAVSESGLEKDSDDDFDSDWDSGPEEQAHGSTSNAVRHETLAGADDDELTEEIRVLHARRNYLNDVLKNVSTKSSSRAGKGSEHPSSNKGATSQANLLEDVVPGYTVLVVDTNIIVTPGQVIQQLIDSRRWTVIIPLAVITELEGLRKNDNELGKEAERAIQFLETRIKTHAKYVKVQTSRSNYLSDLSFRWEKIDFTWQDLGASSAAAAAATTTSDGSPSLDASDTKSVAARNVDEVILRILAWQKNNFVDRRSLLRTTADSDPAAEASVSAHKSVLLTLDRNLRIKAKSRGLASLDAKGAAGLLNLEA